MITYKNWFKNEFVYGGDYPEYFDIWNIKFYHQELNTELDFKQSVRRTLELLAQQNKKLILQYSGGLDSEVILRESLDCGIEVIPYTARFANDVNDHEMHYVYLFEKKFGVKINYIDIDILEWMRNPYLKNGYCEYIEREGVWHAAAPMNWWLRDRIAEIEGDNIIVMNGSGDVPLSLMPKKHSTTDYEWVVRYNHDGHWYRMWYSEQYHPNDVPMFYMYIPELHYSYLTHPIIQNCVQPNSLKLGSGSSRHALYHHFWTDLEPRKKYTGFEKVGMYRDNSLNMISLRAYSGTMSTKPIPYDRYIRALRNTTN